jgi:hypothetical protein
MQINQTLDASVAALAAVTNTWRQSSAMKLMIPPGRLDRPVDHEADHIGKPVGIFLAAAFAARTGVAVKPAGYTWPQMAGADALAGIGFTMSLLIAGHAFPSVAHFLAAKIAVFAASSLAAIVGTVPLWGVSPPKLAKGKPRSADAQLS